MTILDTIKADAIAARKARDAGTASVLTSLIGEVETKCTGNAAIKGPADVDAALLATIKKFIDGAHEMIEKGSGRPDIVAQSQAEIAVLERYRPKQMSEAELRDIVQAFRGANPDAKMGDYMAMLKRDHGGQYDGRMASTVVKETLG